MSSTAKRKSDASIDRADLDRDKKRARDASEPIEDDDCMLVLCVRSSSLTSHFTAGGRRTRNATDIAAAKRFQTVIGLLHATISQHRSGNIFHNPIKESDAPDYHEIVKRPMDLKTIKARIKDGLTSSSTEFQRDIYLMFANAMMYNRPGSDIYMMAEEVSCFSNVARSVCLAIFQDDGRKRGSYTVLSTD